MPRAFVIVLDSVGIGHAPDAGLYGDQGADTLGHIAAACAQGRADSAVRHGALRMPHLARRGLGHACHTAGSAIHPGLEPPLVVNAQYGSAAELSRGKDTPSGHWEIA